MSGRWATQLTQHIVFCVDLFDSKKNQHAFAAEPFILLGLLCEGPLKAKTTFCFTIFDFDHSGTMSTSEMKMLIQTLVRALVKVNMASQALTSDI